MEIESAKKPLSSITGIEAAIADSETKNGEQSNSKSDNEQVIEYSPNKRYGRLNVILGKGAFKVVWKAIDNEEGYEVAWNTFQVLRRFIFRQLKQK